MDAGDLRVFEAVARLGSMSRAAAALNTVQSNVTARIRALEDELQVRLFDRSSRGVTPTAAGRRLLPYAIKIAQLLGDARRAAADTATPAGALTLGSLESTAALRLSLLLTRYVARYPEVDLVLKTGTSGELIDDVLQRRVEGAFVCGPVAHPELATETVFEEELVVLAAPGVADLAAALERREVTIIVLRAGCSYRQRLEEILATRGVVAVRRLEFGTLEAIVACVAAGLGITLLPHALVEQMAREGRIGIHPLPPVEAVVATVFVRRHDAFVSSALAAFLAMARPPAAQQAAE